MVAEVSCVLGVDPGISGGIAFYFPQRPEHVVAEDMPVAGKEVDVGTLVARIKQMHPAFAVIESVHSMPGQGVASTFKFGMAYGAARAALTAMCVPVFLVAPTKWKKYHALPADKEEARALALRLWPSVDCFERKKDHGRAEAALIARYGAEVIGHA